MSAIYRNAKSALFGPVRSTLSEVLKTSVDQLAVENMKRVAPVLKAAEEIPEYRINISPVSEQLELLTKFFVPSPEAMELPSEDWLEMFGGNAFSTSFKLTHPKLYGADPYGGSFQKKDNYSNVYKLEFCIHPPYTIDGQTPFAQEHEDHMAKMLGYIMTIRREFPLWAAQFRNSTNDKILSSHAAYYSNTVGNWLRSLGYVVTPYMRRPNSPYTVSMSPDLNTALSIALALKDAKTVEEAYL